MPPVDVEAEHLLGHSKPRCQSHHDVRIGARLADRRDHWRPQLHMAQPFETAIETGAKPLALPGGRCRQNDIGIARRRIDEEVRVNMELERRQRPARQIGIGLRGEQVGAERHEHAHGIGRRRPSTAR